MYDCDVLIIGAGPVGVTLALELCHYNISFRIVDKAPQRSDKSRALVVQPRTLELLNRHGHAKSLLARGNPITGVTFFVDKKRVTKVSIENLAKDTEFTLPLGISQVDTELFLDECLASNGREVEWSVAAKSISQDVDSVTTTLQLQDGTEEVVRSKYIVGCDGAHSVVRHASPNMDFKGAAYPQDFVLCDARINNTTIPTDCFSLFLGNGTLMCFPMEGGVMRLVAAGHEIAPEEEPTLAHFQSFLDMFAPPDHGVLTDPLWITRFRLHHRSASKFRDGRLFIAGDAAHIHSPVGGQGMNTGIQDAINIGWKLAAVLQGRAANPEVLLDSYDAERRRVGEHLLRSSDRGFNFLASTSWVLTRLRNFLLPWIVPLAASEARRSYLFQFISEFGVTYRSSPIVGAAEGFRGPVEGGDRLPNGTLMEIRSNAEVTVQGICGRYHTLLLFMGAGADTAAAPVADMMAALSKVSEVMRDKLNAHIIVSEKIPASATESYPDVSTYLDAGGKVHAQYGFTYPGYILVRPDLYVAHIGRLSKVSSLITHLSQ